ncbi:MAG TPA: alkaline phosphatase family protein [Candidatus Kapabacteria bacterium]|nr:alkaline phosphatase family protein [Candidatus Kapabacteria bacterium]
MAQRAASTSPIQNVVVLMMENHSFDHMFGYLPNIGTLIDNPQSLPNPADPTGPEISTWEWSAYDISPCPNHDHASTMKQLYGVNDGNQQPSNGNWPVPPMNGFLDEYVQDLNGDPTQLMGCFSPSQLPALSMLATTYTVCTNWFCSVPGPTGPNRIFVNCASSGGYAGPAYQYTDMPSRLATLPSVFDLLNKASLTWQIYHEDPEFFPEGVLNTVQNANNNAMLDDPCFSRFQNDVNGGTLPSYSFLTPTLPNSQHDSWDARVGDNIISLIYNTLLDSSYWEQTLLVITYDEHGGHFDHVPPPQQYTNVQSAQTVTVENPDGKLWNSATFGSDFTAPEFDFTFLGLRVPAVIISAYTPAGIDDTVYEHASISATLNDLFGCGTLTKRDAVANSLLGNVTSTKRTAAELPRAPRSSITKK